MKNILIKSDKLLCHISIGKKIWATVGLFVGVLLIVAVISQMNMQANKTQLAVLVNDVQPAVIQSLNIVDELDRASALLGFYLLSKEKVHQQDYLRYMDKVSDSVLTLGDMRVVQQDDDTLSIVNKVAAGIKKLHVYKDRMLLYASDDLENMKAMKFAAAEVNPRVMVLLGNLQDMIASEKQEKVSKLRKNILLDIYGLRTSMSRAINELRLFLALRTKNTSDNFNNYVDVVEKDYAKVTRYSEDELTFEQFEALEVFTEVYTEYFPLAKKLIEIHGAEDWRLDAYVLRKEISPLVRKIQSNLNTIVKNQYDYTVRSATTLTNNVNHTQWIVASIIVFALILSALSGLILVHAITLPVDALKNTVAELAAGHFDQKIDTDRDDELGSLAQSFADMRDSIRKKIEDLRTLNVTGEIMTSLHEPMAVLEKALKVMRGQTQVQWGSVYLYNEETAELEVKNYYPEKYEQYDDDVEHKARSFAIGEGIAGLAAQQSQIIYIPDTSHDPTFNTTPGADINSRAIICVPMMDNNKIFGVINFCGTVGKVKFEKSDIEFAESIARMVVVSFKNIQMLNVIEEQNRTLEKSE